MSDDGYDHSLDADFEKLMERNQALTTRPLQWCTRSIFWGSHGCTLGDHDGDIHECAVVADGDVIQCSQCRPLEGDTAEVCFWDWEQNRWSAWSTDWKWFTNEGHRDRRRPAARSRRG